MCVTPRFLPPGSRFSTRTRDHRAERDLERPAAEVEVAGAADPRVQIDPIAADADRVGEQLGPVGAQRMRDVLLEDRELGADPPRLADVRRLRESVRRAADDVATQPQARIADAAVGTRRLGLQPVEQAEAELPRGLEVACALGRVDADDRPEPVVVLRPVDDGDVAAARSPPRSSCGRGCGGSATTDARPPRRTARASAARASRAATVVQPSSGPGQPGGLKLAPELVLPGLVDRVVLAGQMLHREADRDRLLISRIGSLRRRAARRSRRATRRRGRARRRRARAGRRRASRR